MFFFRGLWSVFFSLMLVASCWGTVDSPGEKAARNARDNINRLYFDYVFAEENERLLKAIMVSVRRIYDRDELDKRLEGQTASGYQTEARQQLLTELVQQATRHAIAKINGNDDTEDSYLPMFHILQALSNAPSMQESLDVAHWFQTRPVMLKGVLAEDRMDSMESLIQEAVQNSFKEFPSDPLTREQLARQLGFILVEMQELFLRGKALRLLSYKVDKQKKNPQIARDPAFTIYLSLLTEAFNKHPTLWHTDSKRRHYQEDLSALFMKAADREGYGNEWYQQIRRILDGEKPVPVTRPTPAQKPHRHYYRDDDDEWEGWFELTPFRVVLGMSVMFGAFVTTMICLGMSEHEAEQGRQERRQEENLQRKLGKTLNKPGREDPQGRDWKPNETDRKEVKEAAEGFEEKIIKNVLIQAGVLNPLFCNMDIADIYMQISLTELYRYLRKERYIWTEKDEIRRQREQEEYKERRRKEQEQANERAWTSSYAETTSQQNGSESSSSFTYNFLSSDDDSGYVSFGTATATEVQGRDAGWN
ncbi:hypothetical protein [Endozoicomonas sp. ALC020]|uniref:hypothetical protein n=1 Tax=unclassified Endozoicomonas TaxID=2644528 RepID=UPI003BAE1607